MSLINSLYGYEITQCLYAVVKLKIADYLVSGSKSADELAKIVDCQPEALYRVMRCLASFGIFNENPDETFSLNKTSEELLSNADFSLSHFIQVCGEELYHAAGSLLHTIKTGQPAFEYLYGMSHWEYLKRHPEKARLFNDAMEKGSALAITEVIQCYDFSVYPYIIDVGGGKGHLLCGILLTIPECKGLIYDLPHVCQQFSVNSFCHVLKQDLAQIY